MGSHLTGEYSTSDLTFWGSGSMGMLITTIFTSDIYISAVLDVYPSNLSGHEIYIYFLENTIQ